jgi:SOS response regulatory protein OraA/RecX
VIEEAFAAVGEEENVDDAQKEQVLRLLRKRGFDPGAASYEERQKTMAFLHRKGYPADLIRRLTGGGEDW